jgi:resuscitation-promoting factor RpfA
MLSGTGRHRRPRQAPALLIAAGVTGAGIAIPLLGSGAAQAVGDDTWDRTAECESGGLWSANTGSGYYGGFQLTLEMWEEYGGLVFADRPDLASRAQQIDVAERILADQGEEGFPGCALLSGLWAEYSQEQEAEQQRQEAEQQEQDAGDDAVEDGSGPPEQEPEQEQAPETPDAPDAPEAPSGQEGTGQHRGEPAPEESAPEESVPEESAPAESEPEPAPEPEPEPAQGGYEVRSGDMLSGVAAEFDVPGGWPALYQENITVIGDDPDHILPGQRLDLTVTGR